MKTVKLFLIIVLLPIFGFCQSLTGFWTGSLDKGSNPQRKDQSFELNLTEYKGRIYGYSYTTTIVNDTMFYIVKRVKGKIDGDVCEIKDDELLSCNFLSQAEKDIQKTYSFHLSKEDSVWHLDGKWKTNKTKVFYSVSGDIKLSEEKDLTKSKLLPHLQELKINDAVAVAPTVKKQQETSTVKVEAKPTPVESPRKTEAPPVKTDPVSTPPQKEIAKKENQAPAKRPSKDTTSSVASSQGKNENKRKEDLNTVKSDTIAMKADQIAVKPAPKNDFPIKAIAAVNVTKRKFETQQIVDFVSDSLSISLYDNGEIDGDTVSVLINGDLIMANQGLKATAIKKTIFITPAMKDSFTLVLYAENLGKYPPNTGLMIVHDGDDVYQIRFSADLQKNVAVIFKRKKKQ